MLDFRDAGKSMVQTVPAKPLSADVLEPAGHLLKPGFRLHRLPGWKDNRIFQRQMSTKHPGHGCQRFSERSAFSGDGSSRSNLAKIIGDLPAPLMLIDKNPGQLRVRAPSLAQLRENILLLKHTLVVVLPEVSKELRRFHERYGVDVNGAGLERRLHATRTGASSGSGNNPCRGPKSRRGCARHFS